MESINQRIQHKANVLEQKREAVIADFEMQLQYLRDTDDFIVNNESNLKQAIKALKDVTHEFGAYQQLLRWNNPASIPKDRPFLGKFKDTSDEIFIVAKYSKEGDYFVDTYSQKTHLPEYLELISWKEL